MENASQKIEELRKVIETKIVTFDQKYRVGPSLYFYEKVLSCRKDNRNINQFLHNENNIEYLYSALLAWDMNSRGAKMKYFTDFKQAIINNSKYFTEIEKNANNIFDVNIDSILECFTNIYKNLEIMDTDSKLVSTSKLLHFLFPDLMMPMDRTNTLQYFYGNTGESLKRFLEIFKFAYSIAKENINWENIVGKTKWNTSVPKIIDNAIILKMDISIK